MIPIFIIVAICVLVICRKDWKKSVYLLIFAIPYFGFIQLKILHLTMFAPIIHDITIIFPIYVLFILSRRKKEHVSFYLPSYFINFIFFLVFLIIVFTINPFYETSWIIRLVGLKVYIYYLLFILIGFEFIESEFEFKKLCNFFAITAIIPCAIGIMQYLGSYYIDYRETITFFYAGNERLANIATQQFNKFDWGAGIKFFRLPSTFSFSHQFNLFAICMLIPAVTSVSLSKTQVEKFFYSMIIVLLILGAYASGVRATTIYLLFFVLYLILMQAKLYNILIIFLLIIIPLSFINLESYPVLQAMFSKSTEQVPAYIKTFSLHDYPVFFRDHFFGFGVGSATIEAGHYAPEKVPELEFHEGYFARVTKELGVPGLLTMITFLAIIIYEIFLSIKSIKHNKAYILFCSSILAVYLIAIMMSTKSMLFFLKYPTNFLLYFFLGIAIKLKFLNLDKQK